MRLGAALGEQGVNLFFGDFHRTAIGRIQRVTDGRDFALVDELIELGALDVQRLARLVDGHVINLSHTNKYTKTVAGLESFAFIAYNKYITDNAHNGHWRKVA